MKDKSADFGTRKKMSKDWSETILEKLGSDQEYELWQRFTEWLRSGEGQQALKDSGLRTGSIQQIPPEAFDLAGRAFISGWVAREKS